MYTNMTICNCKVTYFANFILICVFLGLTADESHISPIENLDNTISRLYSYLSGSEGDAETDHPLTPPQRTDQWEPGRRRGRSCSPASIPSSRSSSCSASMSDPDHDHTLDTLGSAETGENVYSRINESGKEK